MLDFTCAMIVATSSYFVDVVMKKHGRACGSQAAEQKKTVTTATHIRLVLLNHLD